MTRTILVTVGISLIAESTVEKTDLAIGFERLPSPAGTLAGLRRELKRLDSRAAWQDDHSFEPEGPPWSSVRTALCNAYAALWRNPGIDERQKLLYSGAELASLKRLGRSQVFDPLSPEDHVVLLASDTPSGVFCATLIRDVLSRGDIGLPTLARRAIVERIPGLRPDTGERFLAEGLPNAARKLFEHSLQRTQSLLIGSGGYKGLLPYLGPLCMKLRIPLLYLYEESTDLLELQPLPVELKLQLIRDNQPAFDLIGPRPGSQERRTCRSEDFWRLVLDDDDRKRIHGLHLVDENDGEIKLSATGVIACLLAWVGHAPPDETQSEPLLGS